MPLLPEITLRLKDSRTGLYVGERFRLPWVPRPGDHVWTDRENWVVVGYEPASDSLIAYRIPQSK
jgi:hypothetical protein